MAPSLRKTSKFKAFSLSLANGGTLAGIASFPTISTPAQAAAKPLLVLIHGGKCTPYHFDLSASQTYSTLSDTHGIPVVAIHRPGYGESTSFLPIQDEDGEAGENLYHLTTARWLHTFIFPALWDEFGKPNKCDGVVAMGHSMGGIQLVAAAALYSRDPSASPPIYLLKGIVLSGMGSRFIPRSELSEGFPPVEPLPQEISYQPGVMELLMLNDRTLGLCNPEVYDKIADMDVGMPREELLSLMMWWLAHWKDVAGDVTVPVLYGLGEFDWLWETSEEHIREVREAFTRCERFEEESVKGAPHCIEWSRSGREWMRRVADWVVDVSRADGSR